MGNPPASTEQLIVTPTEQALTVPVVGAPNSAARNPASSTRYLTPAPNVMSMIDVKPVPTTWQAGLDPHWAWRVSGSILQRREPLRPYRSDAAEAPPEAIFI